MTELLDVDLTDPQLYTQGFPHDVFTELRHRGAVHRHAAVEGRPAIPSIPFWSIVTHPEVQQANRDWQTFAAAGGPMMDADPLLNAGRVIVALDPPEQAQLRRTITSEFTPRMIGRLEQLIATRTRNILATAAAGGTCDFVSDIAYQVPMHLIADIVGIPESDRGWVFERTDLLLKTGNPYNGYTDEERLAVQAELFDYAQRLTADKRANPTDDVWTKLAGQLDGFELEMFFLILAIAGSETTRNALTQGLVALLDDPDQFDQLRAEPALAVTAADEAIRWSSPVLFFGRTATRDVTVGGQDITAGDRVLFWYPSANRDENVFEAPFRFDIHRSPNPHVSFGGGGVHYCLGANLARKEVQVVLGTVAAGYDVELAGPPVWAGGGPVHNVGIGIDSLPVRITAR
ncbi:cytochrome [Mycolicibacterium duvalii]|uniref:Cytochrome P450 n=1 Tax=Mycolicibacterium duvalii TaxID=39688 RepID=A0A7I7JXC6_9MYCO|nr:cytochrome P450 [Mycolicibacterium duvalii]MCV7370304.1 cytochrome P450 [Mycolicibacterium duvalii]PEG37274.1 cytochrome [Mycolicibacterium duvalii]BBX16520.1 cytochrome P450 [Mycolicibacterium duvalii]